MKKSVVSLLLCIVMIVALTACGEKETGSTASVDNTPTAGTTAPTATTAPTPEATDVVEEQPEATEAPEVTNAPASPKDAKASFANGDITLKIDELSFIKAPRAEYTIQEDGSVDVRFKQLEYAEIRFLLPERIDLNECSGITVKMRADYDVKCMLLDSDIMWNNASSAFYEGYAEAERAVKEYYFTSDKVDEVYGIGFAPTQEIDDFSLYKATVYSVTFHAKKAEEVVRPTPTPKVSYPKADVTKGDISYKLSELKVARAYGVSYEVTSDHAVALDYTGQFDMIRWILPEAVSIEECTGITINIKTEEEPAWCAFYCYGEEFLENPDNDDAILYIHSSNVKVGLEEYGFIAPDIEDICGIGIMVTEDYVKDYEIIVDSITFHMLSGNVNRVPKEIAPDVTEDMTLLNTYGTEIDIIETCVNLAELQNPSTLKMIKEQYNSVITDYVGNAILAESQTTISIEEAKRRGYVIPAAYNEKTFPELDFSEFDEMLKICTENDLYVRFHPLVFHSARSDWFFREGYSATGDYVSVETMNVRLEMYIRTVMEHVYGGPYGHCVYSWVVVNEHLHADASFSGWLKVYGDERLTPRYVKHAFFVADDVLRKYGIRDEVSLILNDFETYLTINGRNMVRDTLAVLEYVNSDGVICDTIGMESHMDTNVPIAGKIKPTILAFLEAGYKVHLTETQVNIQIPETGKEDQEKYYCEFMDIVLEIVRKGGAISGLGFWGSSDVVSWLREYSPHLFSHAGRNKNVYYKVLQTYLDPDYTVVKEPIAFTYTFNDMQWLSHGGTDYTIDTEGTAELVFPGQYYEAKLLFPEAIDMTKCVGMTVRMQSEYSDVNVKLYGDGIKEDLFCDELYGSWGWIDQGMQNFDFIPQTKEKVYGIGFMSLSEMDDYSKYKATIESVTFYMEQ